MANNQLVSVMVDGNAQLLSVMVDGNVADL